RHGQPVDWPWLFQEDCGLLALGKVIIVKPFEASTIPLVRYWKVSLEQLAGAVQASSLKGLLCRLHIRGVEKAKRTVLIFQGLATLALGLASGLLLFFE